jgi:glycosyltransferase involved in cell wall biosynthesis
MSKNELLLTIGIPVYNGGPGLLESIKSCLNISLPHERYEVLVIDNRSDDGYVEKAQEMKNVVRSLRIIRNAKNIGRIGNWNKLFQEAKGEYFIFLGCNDFISKKNNVPDTIAYLENNPDVGLTVSEFDTLYNGKLYPCTDSTWNSKLITPEFYIRKYLGHARTNFGALSQLIIRTDESRKFKFDEKIDFVTDMIEVLNYTLKFKYVYLNKRVQYTKNEDVSRFSTKKKYEYMFNQYIKIPDYLNVKLDRDTFYSSLLINLYFRYFLSRDITKGEFNACKQVLRLKQFKFRLDFQNLANFFDYCLSKFFKLLKLSR